MHLVKTNRVRAVISNLIALENLTPDEALNIKEQLTYKNPAYVNVKRYSKYSYTRVPEYLVYYRAEGNKLYVPRGFDLSQFEDISVTDLTKENKVEYPKFCLELREAQKEAESFYFKRNSGNNLFGIFRLPTGKGKTILALHLASVLKQKTLVVVHKDDLVTGWKKDIDLCFNKKIVSGLIKAKSRTVGSQITIATIQTLNNLSQEDFDKLVSQFGLVILDEMHHCPATSYSCIAKFPAKYIVGLTATPERADGLAHILNLYFGGFAYSFADDNTQEDKEEDILPIKVIKKTCPVECTPICRLTSSVRGDKYEVVSFNPSKEKERTEHFKPILEIPYENRPKISLHKIDDYVVTNEIFMKQVIDDIVSEYEKGHSCLVFFAQKEHINIYFDELVKRVGINHICKYYGDNKTNDLTLQVAEATRKHITLATYSKCTEGTNVKQWEVAFLVSSIKDGKNVEQAVGRIRRAKECNVGKINPVLVYDYYLPNVYILKNHYSSRLERYRLLKCDLSSAELPKIPKSLTSRGFKR